MKRIIILLISVTLFAGSFANNLQLGTPVISDPTHIQFTVQWDNSWKIASGPTNWDAVWVFIKYQNCASNNLPWQHVGLSTLSTDHVVTGGVLQVDAVTDGKGVFIRRIASGSGNISSATVTLKMTVTDAAYNYQVNGIEMVYVPTGNFSVGDGARGGGNLWGFCSDPAFDPVAINNAVQTAGLGAASNYLQTPAWGCPNNLPATFPLGYNGYYCQKYEISQLEYAAFLNTLTFDQQSNLFNPLCPPNSVAGTYVLASLPSPQNNRNGLRIVTPGVVNNIPAVVGCDLDLNGTPWQADDGQYLPCNWLNWTIMIAYLDWAALRPMTEFEFEKVCRGTATPVANEYPWGTTALVATNSVSISNPGQANETSLTTGSGLCIYGANTYVSRGPLRCGIEATAVTNRAQAGGAFYGAMDMAGNLFEQCIGGQSYNYSTFTNVNGDGNLSAAGAADTPNWPPLGGGQNGGVVRGGEWYDNNTTWTQTSNRDLMNNNFNQTRDSRVGGRGVRNY